MLLINTLPLAETEFWQIAILTTCQIFIPILPSFGITPIPNGGLFTTTHIYQKYVIPNYKLFATTGGFVYD